MTLSAKHLDFNKHLDSCRRCASQPFNLCLTGAQLLHAAVAEDKTDVGTHGFVREPQAGGRDWDDADYGDSEC
jgi:hypothetical protein